MNQKRKSLLACGGLPKMPKNEERGFPLQGFADTHTVVARGPTTLSTCRPDPGKFVRAQASNLRFGPDDRIISN